MSGARRVNAMHEHQTVQRCELVYVSTYVPHPKSSDGSIGTVKEKRTA